MSQKRYKYKNNSYILKPLTLEVLSSAAPLLARFRKLQAQYTADIDMMPVNKVKNSIGEIELSINQLKEKGEIINEARINELEVSLAIANDEFENDSSLQSALRLYNECTALAMLELLGESELINVFMNKSLTCEGGDSTQINIDFSLAESPDFVKEVIADFFVLIAGAGIASAG